MGDTHFSIRDATRLDVELIIDLIIELATYENLENEVRVDKDTLTHSLFVQKSVNVILAEENDIPIGYAMFFYNFSSFEGRRGVFLEDLYVSPKHRGNGYGKALIQHVAKRAVEDGCVRLDWNCLDWNKSSISFYKSLGAKRMCEWTTYRLSDDLLRKFAQE